MRRRPEGVPMPAIAVFVVGLILVLFLWLALNGFGSAWSTPSDVLRFVVLPVATGIVSLTAVFFGLWLLDNPKG